MQFLIMTNGEYGEPDWYHRQLDNFDRIICVDGAARRARALGITPDWLVGDMDSINPADRTHMEQAGVCLKTFPKHKDYTDTQLALTLAVEEGAGKLVVWGGTGSRLDHTISNICSASCFLESGIEVVFDAPAVTIYLIKNRLRLPAAVGDTVSLLVLGNRATGVTLQGFEYPLQEALLEGRWQWAVSNMVTEHNPVIEVTSGYLAVFHYKAPVD
ncbi:MAG: thiamine diphosphokinase [Desulfotomaculaceae bacterium]|nr:thiamine diphosphokinase [Desulfotomaculaceae bacterium]